MDSRSGGQKGDGVLNGGKKAKRRSSWFVERLLVPGPKKEESGNCFRGGLETKKNSLLFSNG